MGGGQARRLLPSLALRGRGGDVTKRRMNKLLGPAIAVVTEFWEHYDDENGPFAQRLEPYRDYASTQFDKRMKVLERDRGKSIDEIVRAAVADLAEEAS